MRVHCLQHVPFEGLGCIEPWLLERGHAIARSPLFESPDLPRAASIDALVIMGGPMSVNDEAEHPWLVGEKALAAEAVAAGKPVLGICLGAQLIASALGARVYRNAEKEIGWFPIEAIPSADASLYRFPASMTAFHWHGETFDLPPGARPIARSEACAIQAFQVGPRVMGLQFHLETRPGSARSLVEHCRDELIGGRFVQDEGGILSAGQGAYAVANAEMGRVLGFLLGDRGKAP